MSSSLVAFCVKKASLEGSQDAENGHSKPPPWVDATSTEGFFWEVSDAGCFLYQNWLLFVSKNRLGGSWDAENGRSKPPPFQEATATEGFFKEISV